MLSRILRFTLYAIALVGCTQTMQDPLIVPASLTFNGWSHVKAVGARVPSAQATDLSAAAAYVVVEWEAFTLSQGQIDGYKIYRSSSANSHAFESPPAANLVGTVSGVGTLTFTDTSVTAGQTYYYRVVPTYLGKSYFPPQTTDYEVKVIVPLANMVLLHRWAANKEMCGLMGKTIDRANNYRCAVATGGNAPPGTGGTGYVDLGASLFVDAYEQGCNYTATNSCTDATVNGGAAGPCIGNRNSATITGNVSANAGTVYYSRQSGNCLINTSAGAGTTWARAAVTTTVNRQLMGSASPGLPPFTVITPPQAQEVCNGQTLAGFAGTKRLMKRREWFLAAAWSASYDDSTISTIENGVNLTTTHHCNSNSGSSITYDNLPTPADLESIPACNNDDCAGTAANIRSLRTGSNATSACVSRYGTQDMVGNVFEWSSDEGTCDGTKCDGVAGAANTTDTTNDDFIGITFDDANIQHPGTTSTYASHGLVQYPLALPIRSASFAGDGVVSQSSAQFHGDTFNVSILVNALHRGVQNGGRWANTSACGRYFFSLSSLVNATSPTTGFRCTIPAE